MERLFAMRQKVSATKRQDEGAAPIWAFLYRFARRSGAGPVGQRGLVGLTVQHDLQPDRLRAFQAHAVLFLATPARGVPVLQVPGRCTPVDTLGGIENRLSDTRMEGYPAKGKKVAQGRAKTGADGRS